ncbi:MAG: hypothetical protein R2744_03630 [Bacteroidales bacterium]
MLPGLRLKGVEKAISGNRIGDISGQSRKRQRRRILEVVRELVGHGLRPTCTNRRSSQLREKGTGNAAGEGMVICIEPMINLGDRNVRQMKDGWTIRTTQIGNLRHILNMPLLWKSVPDILTTFDYIEEVLKK